MRKLLVASQKGGVGKTTTSINLAASTAMAGARVLLVDADPLSSISSSLNLAQHPRRQPLREAGADVPGVLCTGIIDGLDVISPYEDGGCSDDELDDLLKLLTSPKLQESYGCLIVDSPPFMGANPGQLLGACDEFILVMRAEPMAYRTLPAFLELVQRSKRADHPVQMRGILLTLPDGESLGGRWERELRGRFGNRILPQVIPYDEEVGKAVLFGQIVSHAQRDSSAGAQYHSLVEHLGLAEEAVGVIGSAESPLLAVAKQAAGTAKRRPAAVVAAAAVAEAEPPAPVLLEEPADEPIHVVAEAPRELELEEVEAPAPVLERLTPPPARPSHAAIPRPSHTAIPRPTPASRSAPVRPQWEDLPEAPPPLNPPPSSRPAPLPPRINRPARNPAYGPPSEAEMPALSELLGAPMNPPSVLAGGPMRVPGPPKAPSKAPPPPPAPKPPPGLATNSKNPVLIWVGVAVVLGISMRFVEIPRAVLPVLVGVAVAGLAVLVLKLSTSGQPKEVVKALPPRPGARPRLPDAKKPPSTRSDPRKELNTRLAAATRRGPPPRFDDADN